MGSVLIGDDDPLVLMVLRAALERRGLAVTEACDGDELLTLLSDDTYGLCIMDARMPGAGMQDRLDRMEATAPAMPVVVLTGYVPASADPARPGIRFARKPIDLSALDALLAEAELVEAAP